MKQHNSNYGETPDWRPRQEHAAGQTMMDFKAAPSIPAPVPALAAARMEGEAGMARVEDKAERTSPGFSEAAVGFVLEYLTRHGEASGEEITEACRGAGIVPHDDRAFGPVYMRLARDKKIEKTGSSCKRVRGHGTAGGNIWRLRKPTEA